VNHIHGVDFQTTEYKKHRNQAEAELRSGDDDQALQSMSISESFALEASRVAGEEITSEVEDIQWDSFGEVETRWLYRPDAVSSY